MLPPPIGDPEKPLASFKVTTLDYSEYLGRIVIGKLHNGTPLQLSARPP